MTLSANDAMVLGGFAILFIAALFLKGDVNARIEHKWFRFSIEAKEKRLARRPKRNETLTPKFIEAAKTPSLVKAGGSPGAPTPIPSFAEPEPEVHPCRSERPIGDGQGCNAQTR